MSKPHARSSRFATLSFAYAVLGWLMALPLLLLLAADVSSESPPPGWHATVLTLGSVTLVLYAGVGAITSLASGVRVLASGGRVRGLALSVLGLGLNLALGAPGALLVVSVGLIIWLVLAGGMGPGGRPLRIGERPWRATLRPRAWRRPGRLRPRAAAAWARSASSERSAVDAFEHIADDLVAHGAPAGLIARSRAAAE